MTKGIFFFIFTSFFSASGQSQYSKNYYPNEKLQSCGWINQEEKIDYWFYYYENGFKKEEGHYLKNKKNKWWIFYDLNEQIFRKTEYKDDKPNGLSLLYKQGNIIKAEKYKMGHKLNEWNNVLDYQKDNQK